MGTKVSIERPQKPRLRSLSSPREEEKPLLEAAGSTVGKLNKHSTLDFEEYSLSDEKGKKPKVPLLIVSSPSRIERHVALEGDDPSPKNFPPAKKRELQAPKMESPATLPKLELLSGPPLEVYRRSSAIPCGRIKEYELLLRSEMAKEKLHRCFKVSMKEVNGAVELKFSRRSNGGFVLVDPRPLRQAIQRAERLMESPVDLDA